MAMRSLHTDPLRIAAAAVELSAGAVVADGDMALCEALLERLCGLTEADGGAVVRAEGPGGRLHVGIGVRIDQGDRSLTPGVGLEPTVPFEPVPAHVLDVPLLVHGHVVGRLVLARTAGRPFATGDRAIAELVAPRFALLVERHHLTRAEAEAREAAASAVAALREKETRFEALIDGAFTFLGLLAPDGELLEVNRAALEFAAVDRSAVLGRPFWETPWWSHDAILRDRLRSAVAAAAAGQPSTFDATHIAPGGSVIEVEVTLRRTVAADGRTQYLIAEGRDVTDRRAEHRALADDRAALAQRVSAQADRLALAQGDLHQAQALYRAMAETIVDGLVVIDERGSIEWLNPVASQMFGYDLEQLRGQNVKLLMPAPFHDEHDGYLRRYLTTGERRIIGIGREVRGRRASGEEFPLSLAVGETVVGGVRKFTGILRDLSAQKQMEHLLQERQTLARVGELAAVVAHEVRNPLAAIKGVVEVIQTRFPADSPDRKVLGDLLTRVDSLEQLVSDLLVYARPAPPAFRMVPILGLVRETVAMAAGDPLADRVRFEVDGPDIDLSVDPGQMGRAMLNLMTNAAQAMRQGGVVRVVGERSGSLYRLRLIDEGPGMDADVVARCQEPFFTTKTRGTGLGLPIARRVVEEHHGAFRVESAPGQGTTVVIELPAPGA
jgi:two-component system sensor kinase FixL